MLLFFDVFTHLGHGQRAAAGVARRLQAWQRLRGMDAGVGNPAGHACRACSARVLTREFHGRADHLQLPPGRLATRPGAAEGEEMRDERRARQGQPTRTARRVTDSGLADADGSKHGAEERPREGWGPGTRSAFSASRAATLRRKQREGEEQEGRGCGEGCSVVHKPCETYTRTQLQHLGEYARWTHTFTRMHDGRTRSQV